MLSRRSAWNQQYVFAVTAVVPPGTYNNFTRLNLFFNLLIYQNNRLIWPQD